MILGIESFREMFSGFDDCYTVIGGSACDILMTEAGLDFRATKDIDMILILEARSTEFAQTLWQYIREGHYRCGWKNSDSVCFYRFTDPKAGYPSMIELFSRDPGYELSVPSDIVPIHIDDNVSSLSAILLNDDFYKFMLAGRKTIDGINVLEAEYLIPFKMYAWLNHKDRKAAGLHVNDKDIKKHKNDVFRLLQIVTPDRRIETNGLVRDVTVRFLSEIEAEDIPFKQMGLPFTKDEAMSYLRDIYI